MNLETKVRESLSATLVLILADDTCLERVIRVDENSSHGPSSVTLDRTSNQR